MDKKSKSKGILVGVGVLLLGIGLALPLFNGCKTVDNNIEDAAPFIKLGAITGVKVAWQQNEGEDFREKYTNIMYNAVIVLDDLVLSDTFNSGEVVEALGNALKVNELQDNPEIKLAAELVLDLYEVKYKELAKRGVDKNEVAKIVLVSITDGIKKALNSINSEMFPQ